MPELPEVETVCRGLAPHLTGRRIEAVQCFRADLRYALPDMSRLVGRCCERVARRGKYLQFFFDDLLLVWHLGMTGKFHVIPAQTPLTAHEHVRFELSGNECLSYRDARRFGYAGLMATDSWEMHPWFAKLGPEPLGDDFDGQRLMAFCRGRKGPIKPLLMNAQVVVGVGNIYACEALFRAGIHPERAAGRISAVRLFRLVDVVREVLGEAIASGGSTISDFSRVDGSPGYFSHNFAVYGREGEKCPHCAGSIRRIVQAGRSTFYCPNCQR
ncbi:MAG: bifunctional DNA-formamidopyrimidine glycosylase/DNA-(apurinic or apyrimidinic site) lyase [Zetaproteobacteria bacterium CG12_big_fil_rev_8_21_14_0_65_55_1124]|nr:MAG: DNA-formamidopyrimidine glycosylase [Zetaproteobacteria bacterium CG1_02_55_237]PIS18462.1 MAG: bifunctional DNA-formamidopyrimidine glycosylase/DNA-(apurinic or apyrimidinic site) lyase [Zetaproteobacteria bacterium CG08_land_8_20_14_0_20_55_17]PIW42220.1 MAG: bifunctional DNA-formamidopyrimidine glycosylase/DNA-(apurinic or apyrimidinic site) lyase [Zetaproteobacteria bacterium CG12_big_fil_rev_8_21_14_0_65_55_1124]PIY53789.1 MAG: bifunctional DNA-formamidopyrimidine glycosylase/DNA-(a